MLALRSLSRSAPRSAARLSTKAIRPQPSLLRQTAAFHPSWSQAAPKLTSSFHMSALRRQDNSSGLTEELTAKLQSEISMEESVSQHDDDLTANIKEYLDNSPFKIEDKPGHQEVVLTRTFGDENIRVTFSTADLNNNLPGEEFEESAYEDADLETQSGGANTKGAVTQGGTSDGNVRVAAEDGVSDEVDEGLDEEDQGFPAHVNVTIERPGKGALSIEATAQDGDFLIEEFYHFSSADLADPATAEKEWQRRTAYTGPPFNNLDEDLQILLEKYLEERGINTRLALFIPDYIDHKEQKEYVKWLNNVKAFVE